MLQNDNFKSFKYKTKIIATTATANGILENATIAVSLKYLSNFWRLLQMSLINSKVELKLQWKKHCLLSTSGIENTNADPNNFISTIKSTKLYIPVVTLSAKDNQKISKLPTKGFERPVDWYEPKTKKEHKDTTIEYRYFLKSNFADVNRLFYFLLLLFIQVQMIMQKGINLKDITCQKAFLRIMISSSMERTFMTNQLILI